jgi:hypothetical protein
MITPMRSSVGAMHRDQERHMSPARNRVTPMGDITAIPLRGAWTGNRGILHSGHEIVRFHASDLWITCALEFRGRRQEQWQPGHYTFLYFHDEAVSFAAGHRPCAECRHADYVLFKEFWRVTNRGSGGRQPGGSVVIGAEQMDNQLQQERMNADGTKRLFQTRCDDLPDGVFVSLATGPDAYLVWREKIFHWTPAGYDTCRPIPRRADVQVLTPRSTVRVIAAGYEPVVHPTVATARHHATSRTILSDDLE